MKAFMYTGATIGGLAGGFLPALWGDNNILSVTSLMLGTVGTFAGLWAGYKIGRNYI